MKLQYAGESRHGRGEVFMRGLFHIGRRRTGLVLLLAALVLSAGRNMASGAAIVTFILSINDNGAGVETPGEFAVYASDSNLGPNSGIASFQVDIAKYSTVTNLSPFVVYHVTEDEFMPFEDFDLDLGFALSRSTAGAALSGAQNLNPVSVGGTEPVYGIGQQPGAIPVLVFPAFDDAQIVASSPSTSFSDPVLLGTGTFTGLPPLWNNPGSNVADLFTSDPGTGTEEVTPGNGLALVMLNLSTELPEPAALGILAAGGACLLSRRRARTIQ
jgi:hypothetical protein